MPRQRYSVLEYDLPVSMEVSASIAGHGSSLAELAILRQKTCREKLQAEWADIQSPRNRAIGDYILSLPALCLSEWDGNYPGYHWRENYREYWLTFSEGDDERLSIVTGKHTLPWPDLNFPVDGVPGLREFMTLFGGITDWFLPPGSRFCTPGELRVMGADKDDWGMIDDWYGSLVFFHGGTGNELIVRTDGFVGKWDHDIGWGKPNEPAVRDLQASFSQVLSNYIDYCKMGKDSDRKAETPFYY